MMRTPRHRDPLDSRWLRLWTVCNHTVPQLHWLWFRLWHYALVQHEQALRQREQAEHTHTYHQAD